MDDSYSAAQARLARFCERDHELVGQTGRTLALLHGARTPRAVVLFHGLSASPTQFSQIAHGLHERGYNVLVPRLPRHGHANRMTDALARLTAQDLKDIASESVAIANGLGETTTVGGFSLGGLLAAWIAQNEPVERAVLIAPFLGINWLPHGWSARAAALTLRLPNVFNWWDPIRRERQLPEHGYPRYASHSLAQAYVLANELLESAAARPPRAGHITIVTNAREAAVNNRSARKLVRRWEAHPGVHIATHEFTDLPISHDIIEPMKNPKIVAKVYPVLMRLLDGQPA
jgi:pimeloyl-ACP methyl ester carboxylesterase